MEGDHMISAEVIKAVQEELTDCGIEQRSGESFDEFVARGLGVTATQAKTFLDALNSGSSVDEAKQRAEIEHTTSDGVLRSVATRIGVLLGRMARGG